MIDLIEYIVGELKSKRLSKDHAVSLVRQMAQRPPAAIPGVLHPLVQQNTSDLSGQRYRSVFSGTEPFVADHKVRPPQGEARPVLPAVAYLEMARAAVEQACPGTGSGAVLELHDVVWAQPIVLDTQKTVHLAIAPADSREPSFDFEVYSSIEAEDAVHCQGRAAWPSVQEPPTLDLAAMRARMGQESLAPAALYARFAAVGLLYGPGFRTVESVVRGDGELLAGLRLPAESRSLSATCVLPPPMLDGALQAAVALLGDTDSQDLRLPFALERLRVLHPCTPEMLAWVRLADGCHANDPSVKVDLDLCDNAGRLCVEMRGFCSRIVGTRPFQSTREPRVVFAAPEWVDRPFSTVRQASPSREPTSHLVLLCGPLAAEAAALQELLPGSRCLPVAQPAKAQLADRYMAWALGCFHGLRNFLAQAPGGALSVHLLGPGAGDDEVFAGLSGLLRTAALEEPRLAGSVLLLEEALLAAELRDLLVAERRCEKPDPILRYTRAALPHGQPRRQALLWKEMVPLMPGEPPAPAFRDDVTYVITGGLGGLGLLFAREILTSTSTAKVILTGRSGEGGEKLASITQQLPGGVGRIAYRKLVLTDPESVTACFDAIRSDFGPIAGILHSAGMVATTYLQQKETAEFERVLEPKVRGLALLDRATANDELDFFAMFSSLGALGNMGMADYAVANGFMDRFAAVRNCRVVAGERHGATRSINWPLWAEGGMGFDSAMQEVVGRSTGEQDTAGDAAMGTFYHMVSRVAARLQLAPLQTREAMDAFSRGLALPCDQFAVLQGNTEHIRQALPLSMNGYPDEAVQTGTVSADTATGDLAEKAQSYLRRQLSSVLKVPVAKIDARAPLEEYGMDSILAMRLTNELEKDLGPLSKTLFFEYRTLAELTAHLAESRHEPLQLLLLAAAPPVPASLPAPPVQNAPIRSRRGSARPRSASVPAPAVQRSSHEAVAIVGLSGRYPQAPDLHVFWQNLREGKDCITEVPPERWDWRAYLSTDRTEEGRHFSKWGGFIEGVDEFDPLFFNVSPTDATLIDPQERLFLQHAWMAMEDAGYTRAELQAGEAKGLPGAVGVYAGLMYSEYQLFGAELSLQDRPLGVAGSAASVANRVSFTLNLHGPSMTVDTMCSASLTAIHLACQDLRAGRIEAAFAGGVNVSIHPNKYLCLSAGQFISSDGHCQSFGVGGDGYIPGEGVGVVFLKRLADAERDGDHIYGVLRGSAINHGGRTNGYSVPNPRAQTGAIEQAMAEAEVRPEQISYIEAHGTGTRLGDPIEIAALERAFGLNSEALACAVGSVKSNIGHCESAAGIAGLTKVLLQMQHGQLVPSLHSAELNPFIDFSRSPFVVNQTLRPWEPPSPQGRTLPRIAGVSSFGAGGSNAHLIVEEYTAAPAVPEPPGIAAILLSARTPSQLEQKARDLVAFVREAAPPPSLRRLAYTLQQGREPMEERLALTAGSLQELAEKLELFFAGGEADEVFRGQKRREEQTLDLFNTDPDMRGMLEKWLQERRLGRLLELWVKGVEVDWRALYPEGLPRRMSLPTYPFSRDRYWLNAEKIRRGRTSSVTALHPLLHRNVSDLHRQCFVSLFEGNEPFLADHRWRSGAAAPGESSVSVLPAAAFVEMVRAAVRLSLPPTDSDDEVLTLTDLLWVRPLQVTGPVEIRTTVTAEDEGAVAFQVERLGEEEPSLLFEGRAYWTDRRHAGAAHALSAVRAAIASAADFAALTSEEFYAALERMGLVYGPSHRTLHALTAGDQQVLATLRLPSGEPETGWGVPPGLLDGALQACSMLAGLGQGGAPRDPQEQRAPLVPVGVQQLAILGNCSSEMYAVARPAALAHGPDQAYAADVDLCDAQGKVCVQVRGFLVRRLPSTTLPASQPELAAYPETSGNGTLYATPVWQAVALPLNAGAPAYEQRHVWLCGLASFTANQLALELHDTECVALAAAGAAGLAERYTACALDCFDRLKALVSQSAARKILLQVVVGEGADSTILTALTPLLQTAMLERPSLKAQVIAVPQDITGLTLGQRLQEEQRGTVPPLVRYEAGQRSVLGWREIKAMPSAPPFPLRDRGVYLITGGLGGLGTLFARDLLQRSPSVRVVLTGRAPSSVDRERRWREWPGAERVSYRSVDLGSREQVDTLIDGVLADYGRLDGVLHSAGMVADSLLRNKSRAQFEEVLNPKVTGTVHLDEATASLDLHCFVLFSSVAAAMGNPGQADYAAANAFMDRFAAQRNLQRHAGRRRGITRSINWPLWQDGGMTMPAEAQAQLFRTTGMAPLRTETGLAALWRCLSEPDDQVMVVEGDLPRMRLALTGTQATATPVEVPRAQESPAHKGLQPVAEDLLREQMATLFRIPVDRIHPEATFDEYGIDSVLVLKLTSRLEEIFGPLSKTLLFEHQTPRALAYFLAKTHVGTLERLGASGKEERPAEAALRPGMAGPRILSPAGLRLRSKPKQKVPESREDIAIIGMAGRYPKAEDLAAFWKNLRDGENCITAIPAERWDHAAFFSADPTSAGKTYSRWGGFLQDVDRFDARFFNITPREAELIDPQERLFLQTAWHTFEDAGYPKEQLSGRPVGVYVGVMWSHYELLGAEHTGYGVPSSSHASIANRVSYFFNLQGPSLALDTMCSSSMTAIHLACEALRSGAVDAALAGGVNLTLHPYKYLSLSQGRFLASDGLCRSFAEGGDGYVPGEGVGAVLLKPLAEALRDGDRIRAVIRGSSVNHGGKTNGYTVPNPVAQGTLIRAALKAADVPPDTVSYIEAHGTGTSLGDPIEMSGLASALKPEAGGAPSHPCALGSVKSNIGHLEAAAGIAAVTKTVLQLEHRELVPSLHAEVLNPYIDWEQAPVRVQTALAPWHTAGHQARRAGVSSFGAGGANAHLVLQEAPQRPATNDAAAEDASLQLILLSAHNPEALLRSIDTWRALCAAQDVPSLADIAYTSQIGRTALPVRLAVLAQSRDELSSRLERWRSARLTSPDRVPESQGVFFGGTRHGHSRDQAVDPESESPEALARRLASGDLAWLGRVWAAGADVAWSALQRTGQPRKAALPLYPFARERYWLAPSWGVDRGFEHLSVPNHLPEIAGGAQSPLPARELDLSLRSATVAYLQRIVGEEIRLAPERIDAEDRLESLGLESVALQNILKVLSQDLGELPQTLFYERGTLLEVAQFLMDERETALVQLLGEPSTETTVGAAAEPAPTPAAYREPLANEEPAPEPIAIVGVHGAFPQSPDLDTFWENLRAGRDLVVPVPKERWDAEALTSPDPEAAEPAGVYCRWGGFLDDVDRFDAPFFRISPEEACSMDPQERLFLQSVWAALEDAGYTRDRLAASNPPDHSTGVGVFVGVTNSTYHLWAAETRGTDQPVAVSSLPWSIANRVSYFFDFHGPSMPVDTACSSSLVAVHLACESLRRGECAVSLAGGVNLYLHPAKYRQLCARHMLARHGRCRSYGVGDDGFVPGEGVGTLVLKRLADAVRDRDRIHAVITGSGYDHAGRSHGYSAPSPHAQTRLVQRVLRESATPASTVSYVEGHGTGTQMGDSLEISALTAAFALEGNPSGRCALGSVKTNIGHTEAAAGMAGIAKILLQMRSGELAPSLHAREINPGIVFAETPFTLQRELGSWQRHGGAPRRALVNAFGAGGVNACVLLEEYRGVDLSVMSAPGSAKDPRNVAILSARNATSLCAAAEQLLRFLQRHPETDWDRLCFTLQTGREAMEERLAVPAGGIPEFLDQLERWLQDRPAGALLRGTVPHTRPKQSTQSMQADTPEAAALAARWIEGEKVPWLTLYASPPFPMSLPTYPFDRHRYWFTVPPSQPGQATVEPQIHPLISQNSSTLRETSFLSLLSERDYLGTDHRIRGASVLPGAALLEIACVAGTIAGEDRVLGLRDIVWIQPLLFQDAPVSVRAALRAIGDDAEYVISTLDEAGETVIHSEGRVCFRGCRPAAPATLQKIPLAERLAQCTSSQSGERYYAEFRERGFTYGPALQPIREIHFGPGFALARMELPETHGAGFDQFVLHPALIDGALQTAAGLLAQGGPTTPHVPFALDELWLHHPLPRRCYSLATFADARDQGFASMHKFHLQLLSEEGVLLAECRNLFVRALTLGAGDPPDDAAETANEYLALGSR